MAQGIASVCVGIVSEIRELQALRSGLEQELHEAAPSMKPFLLREIRLVNIQLSQLRQALRDCQEQNPPGPRPDLYALGVKPNPNHEARTVGFAALIKNIGRGIAYGPFDIALSVSLYRGGALTNYVRIFEVPAGLALYGEPVLQQLQPEVRQEDGNGQPAAQSIGFNGSSAQERLHTPSQEYITEEMVLPLYYWDDSPSARYKIQFTVDGEHQVLESNESNNQFDGSYLAINPQSRARTSMVVIEEEMAA